MAHNLVQFQNNLSRVGPCPSRNLRSDETDCVSFNIELMCYGSSKQAIPDQSILSRLYRTADKINLFEMETPYQGTSIKDNHTYSYTNHPSRYDHWNMQLDPMVWTAVIWSLWIFQTSKLSKLPWRTEISNFSPNFWNKTNFICFLNTRNIVILML